MSRKLFTLLLLSAVLAGGVFASNGTQIGNVGARGTAMGTNFRGLANDWSAFFHNPAGLAQLKGLTIGGSLALITPRGSYQPYAFPSNPWSGLYTNQRDAKAQNFYIPSFGVFYNFNESITVGIGVAAPFGLGAQFDLITVPDGYRGTGDSPVSLEEEFETQSDHQVVSIQPTIAFDLGNGFSVGGGFNYMPIGSMSLRQVKLPEYSKVIAASGDAATLAAYQGLIGTLKGMHPSGAFPDVYNPAHDRIIVETFLDGEGTAYGVNLGIHYKASEAFSIGASAQYYTDLKLTGDVIAKTHMPGGSADYIQTLSQVFAAIPGAQTVDSLQAVFGTAAIFSGETDETTYEAEASLPLPLTLGIGVAIKPLSKLTLVADFSWTRWASWDTIDVFLLVPGTYQEEKQEMVENWKSTLQVGLGAEFNVFGSEDMGLDLRAGFYRVNTPAPYSTISPLILDPKNRTIISAGFGFRFAMFELNFCYERVILGEKDIQPYWYHFDSMGVNENWAGIYNLNANVFTADLSISL